MAALETLPKNLPPEVRQTVNAWLAEAVKLFGPALEAVLLYGSAVRGEFLPGRSNLNLLVVLNKRDLGLLGEYAQAQKRWSREGIVAPLILAQSDLARAARLFPLEWQEITETHLLLAGRDVLQGLPVDLSRLPAQCEQEIAGNLLRLRQRFVEGGGTQEAMLLLLPLSLTALLPCLRGLLRSVSDHREPPRQTDAMLERLPSALGVEPAVFQEVLRLKRGLVSPGPVEVPRLFDRYVAALESLLERVAVLRQEGKP